MGNCCKASTSGETFVVQEAGVSLPVRRIRGMGWKRDLPDHRDKYLALPEHKLKDLPAKVDLRPAEHFAIYNQGSLGSCTANAIGGAFHFAQVKEGKKDFVPSRLFIYYNERSMEGTTDQDSGAYIRDGIKSLTKLGVCDETTWPYDEKTFTNKPTSDAYKKALPNKAKEYAKVESDLDSLKACLNEGFPIAFGFTVMTSFEMGTVAANGWMSMPQVYDQVMGGHAVLAVGYDDAGKVFIVRNSWGESWGDKGYFYMPYDYITNPGLAEDFWCIKFVDGQDFPTKTKNAAH